MRYLFSSQFNLVQNNLRSGVLFFIRGVKMGRRTALSQELRMKTQPRARFHDSFPMKNQEGGVGSRKSIAISEVNVLELTYWKYLQSRTKLLEKVFPITSTFLRNKTISKTTPLRKENPFPQFNVASHKRPGIRLSFESTTTLLSGEGGEGKTGTATMFRKMLSKYTVCFIIARPAV